MALSRKSKVALVAAGTVVLALVVGAVALLAVIRPASRTARSGGDRVFFVASDSMAPTLRKDDRVAAQSAGPLDPRAGDVVVFTAPESTSHVLKRVVAVGPASVAFADGRVLVDDRPLDEPYLPDGTRTEPFPANIARFACTTDAPCAVPQGSVFVLGDNRANSKDSRVLGPLAIDDLQGIALEIVYPEDRVGKIPGSPR